MKNTKVFHIALIGLILKTQMYLFLNIKESCHIPKFYFYDRGILAERIKEIKAKYEVK